MTGARSPTTDEAIRTLICAYADRLDRGDLDGVADLFADGVFRSARTGEALNGRDAVRRLYEPVVLYGDGTPRTMHVLSNVRVSSGAEADRAQAQCSFTVLQRAPGAALRPVLAGRYEDSFARVDGTWRFAERIVHADLIGDLSGHMRHGRG